MDLLNNIIKKKNQALLRIRNLFDKHSEIKFASIIILLVTYFFFASKSHGIKDGFLVSILSWSFFILCTPIADAGFLIDFPIRLITGIKMIHSEMIVWILAISLNIFTLIRFPALYDKTILLSLFKHIIITPFPFLIIIILSALGTFISIYLADKMIDVKKGKKKKRNFLMKHKIIIFTILTITIIICYNFLLKRLGISII